MSAPEQPSFPPPPRKAKLMKPNRGLKNAAGFFAIAVLGLLYIGYLINKDCSMAKNGRETAGKVLRLEHRYRRGPDLYRVYYTYKGMPAGMIQAKGDTTEGIWKKLKPGRTFPVTFLSDKPEVSVVGRPQDIKFYRRFYSDKLTFGAIALVLVTVVFGILSIVEVRKDLYLVKNGVAVTGTVDALTESGDKGARTYQVSWTFPGPGEILMKGKRSVAKVIFQQLSEGQEITILYDPFNPKQNAPYMSLHAVLVKEVRFDYTNRRSARRT